MKVFFTASQRGRKEFGKYYNIIIDELKKSGYTLIDDDILNKTPNQLYKQLETGRKANVEFYKNKLDHIQQSDIVVFESSTHSLSVGFVIEKALEYNKPTVVLYFKENCPYFLSGDEDEKLVLKNYNEKNLIKILNSALELAKERRDKRFNFFISPKLLNYLEKTSKNMGITKSKFIRNLLLEHMKKHTVI